MLKPEYFDKQAKDRLLEMTQDLEDYIFRDIANRLLTAGEMSGTTDRLIWRLEQMGQSREAILTKLQEYTKLSRQEIKALLQDAVLTSWEDDRATYEQLGVDIVHPLENPNAIRVMNAEYVKCQKVLENLTRTTMDRSQIDLMNMLNEAEFRVANGIQSYSAAVCDILDKYAETGLSTYVTYRDGKYKMTLESAVNMIVRTSSNQTAAQVTNQYITEAETNCVLVSAHYGARTAQKGQPPIADHSKWQGKAYLIRGSKPGFPNLLESTGYDINPITGEGVVTDVRSLHGINCRHSHQPWDESLNNPWTDDNGNPIIDSQQSKELYENEQKQRAMERAIRKTKRQLLMKEEELKHVAETDVKEILQQDYDRLAYKLRQQNQRYNEFCKDKDLKKQYSRLKGAGFGKKESARANGAATRNQKKKESDKS